MQTLSQRYTKNCQFVHDRYIALSNLPKNGKIAEIGVLAGDLSEWFLKNMDPQELHLIDVYNCPDFPGRDRFKKKENESFVRNRFNTEILDNKVFIKKGLSWDMMATYDNDYFDIVYIDAAHDYDSVKKDLNLSVDKVKEDGYIVLNDYIMYDHLSKSPYGVVQATNEFCVNNDWELLYFAFHPNLFCDVVLRKIQQ